MTKTDREELLLLKSDVEHIKNDVAETKKTVNDFNDKMTRITQKLFNDNETGEEGLISVALNNRVRLSKLENVKIAVIYVILAIGGAIGWVVKSFLK